MEQKDVVKDNLIQKQCKDCCEIKSINLFYKLGKGREGYQPYCKPCNNLRTTRNRRNASPESKLKAALREKEYRQRPEIRARKQEQQNVRRKLESSTIKGIKRKELIRKWRADNAEYVRIKHLEYVKESRSILRDHYIRAGIRRYFKRKGFETPAEALTAEAVEFKRALIAAKRKLGLTHSNKRT